MGALLKLMGRQSQDLVKVQAPSADLIKSDIEFLLPEPEEIKLEMEPEKLESYASMANVCEFAKETIGREMLLHFLKLNDFKIYDREKVNSFMKLYVVHAFNNLKLGNDLWWQWIELKKYRHPLPFRVTERISTIFTSNKNALFFVSDIILITKRFNPYGSDYGHENTNRHIQVREVIPMKRLTEICFLRVDSSSDTLPEESLIIDAWRGPTFSDEEARLP